MLTIFFFSHDSGMTSTKKSNQVILGVSNFFSTTELSLEQKEKLMSYLIVPVRKSAHFIIYLILGILIISNFKEYFYLKRSFIFLSIALAFLYACSDEVHQLFISGRSGQFSDVLLDTVGAGVGCFLYYFVYKKKEANVTHE